MEGGASPKRKRYTRRKSTSRKLKQIKRQVQSIKRKLSSIRRSRYRRSPKIYIIRSSPSARPKIYVPPAEYRYSASSQNYYRPKVGEMRSNEYEFNNRYYAKKF